MNKKVKTILLVLLMLSVVGYFTLPTVKDYMVNNMGKRDLQSEEAAFTLKAKDVIAEFTTKEAEANKKYLEKPVVISGSITSINGKEVILDEVVVCVLNAVDSKLIIGQTIEVKGRVIGYDDLMGSVNMDQCSINK